MNIYKYTFTYILTVFGINTIYVSDD